MRARLPALGLYALVAALLAYSWMPSRISVPNERSRVYQAVALVDGGTLSIDGPFKRFGRIGDVARFQGKRYTDKAPGSGFLAAGVYAAARAGTAPGDWRIGELIDLVRTWLMIPIGILGFFLLRRLLAAHGASPPAIDVASLAWILGSAAFHYSTAVYGHQIVAVLLLYALWQLANGSADRRAAALQHLGLGLAAGLAGFTEYQAALWCVPLAAIVVFRGVRDRRPERIAAFALGAGAFAALLLAYNWSAFGEPFALSYHHLTAKMQGRHSAGIAGVGLPTARGLVGILFSAHRGLLTTSPFFALALPGLVLLWRKGARDAAILSGIAFAGYLAFVSGAEVWQGGWAYGPRLLVPILGALALPAALALDRLGRSGWLAAAAAGLAAYGIATYQLAHLALQELPTHCLNPIRDVVLPAYRAGAFSPNLFSAHLGIGGWAGIVPALALIAVAIAVVVVRARRLAERPAPRVAAFGLPLAIAALLLAAVAALAPTWKEAKTRAFMRKVLGVAPPAAAVAPPDPRRADDRRAARRGGTSISPERRSRGR